MILACRPAACPRHYCRGVRYWIQPMACPHWPTGIDHPLGCAGVDMPPCVPCSVCRVSEQPVMICTPPSSNTQLEQDDNTGIVFFQDQKCHVLIRTHIKWSLCCYFVDCQYGINYTHNFIIRGISNQKFDK